MPAYQQSSTRRLAFGSSAFDSEASKPQKDFYNNNTLVNLSKMFCVIVLLTAFVLVMSRSFGHFIKNDAYNRNSTVYFAETLSVTMFHSSTSALLLLHVPYKVEVTRLKQHNGEQVEQRMAQKTADEKTRNGKKHGQNGLG
ncbi:hypothetical protein ANCCEY_14784 [Ancylostoma ceylanicum]|uniref:Uncharacterized protein n=1 Tax=Ancylostoma ceylanicum TaxID=53326 RepID=A0A0D6L4H8_9BILA|nr:hypothetical protein ANCCEY_14784 [Ancylostoma ceylanicum]